MSSSGPLRLRHEPLRPPVRSVRSDAAGVPHQAPIADLVDIAVFGEGEAGNGLGKPLAVWKVWVRWSTVGVEALHRTGGGGPRTRPFSRANR